jgi:DnaJ-class molecular chaperone
MTQRDEGHNYKEQKQKANREDNMKKNKGEYFEIEIEQSCTLCDGSGFDCDERCDDCGGSGETTSLADFEWCDETNNYVCDWYGEYDLEDK